VSPGLLLLADTAMELSETGAAMSDERALVEFLRQRQA
jgi:hypothetical protein